MPSHLLRRQEPAAELLRHLRGQQVEIGGELYSDAMGAEGTAGGTYIGMIYENTLNITEALGGTVPPLPDALAEWAEQWGIETTAN